MHGVEAVLLIWLVVPIANLQAQEPTSDWESRHRERFAIETLGAAAGAVGTSIAFAYFGATTTTNGGESPGLLETLYGAMAGSIVGSAIGVSIVGKLTHDSGKLGSAFLGSIAGLTVFFMMAPSLDADYASFYLAFWGLPAVGAVTGYALSRDESDNRALGVQIGDAHLSVRPQRGGATVGVRVAF